MAVVTCEIVCLLYFLRDIGVQHNREALLFYDSQATLNIGSNPMFHERTKHIENDCHVVRDKVLEKVIKLIHVRTHCQLADLLTKALNFNQFSSLICKIGMVNIHSAVSLKGEYQNVKHGEHEKHKHEKHKGLTKLATRQNCEFEERKDKQELIDK